jgi:hypothetical protein
VREYVGTTTTYKNVTIKRINQEKQKKNKKETRNREI